MSGFSALGLRCVVHAWDVVDLGLRGCRVCVEVLSD